jgi:hypothetical protein
MVIGIYTGFSIDYISTGQPKKENKQRTNKAEMLKILLFFIIPRFDKYIYDQTTKKNVDLESQVLMKKIILNEGIGTVSYFCSTFRPDKNKD